MAEQPDYSSPTLIRPVVLCGGMGESLWPVSRAHLPKQLADFSGGHSLLQKTLMRVRGPLFSKPLLVSGEDHRFMILDQLAELGVDAECIILESIGRDTAPAIAQAAEWLMRRDPDEIMLVLASDHVIDDDAAFRAAVTAGVGAARSGNLVTFGVVPTRAETAYGYIRAAPAGDTNAKVTKVVEFVEKPSPDKAEAYLNSGDYLWNAGIFLFRAQQIRDELTTHAPAVAAWADAAIAEGSVDAEFFRPLEQNAQALCPAISIDYAVLERSEHVCVLRANMGWSDLGSWNGLWERAEHDPQGNAVQGNALALDSAGSLVFGYDGVTVAAVGVEDLIVVATRDAVLVTSRDKAREAGKVVNALKLRGDSAGELPSVIHRPWGTYQTTDRDERFQTKRIVVKPGAKLSSQLHHHRSEHWVVVSGTAEVTVGEKTFLLHENQSTYINAGTVHRLANPGKVPLHLVEVQCGTYLGEDDIVRFEDVYGRSGAQPGER